jgi:hypothetical protein
MANTTRYRMRKTDRIMEAAAKAASEITDLWWTRPEHNGHIKAQIVRDIITKHMIGVPPVPVVNPLSQIETLEEVKL